MRLCGKKWKCYQRGLKAIELILSKQQPLVNAEAERIHERTTPLMTSSIRKALPDPDHVNYYISAGF